MTCFTGTLIRLPTKTSSRTFPITAFGRGIRRSARVGEQDDEGAETAVQTAQVPQEGSNTGLRGVSKGGSAAYIPKLSTLPFFT